MASVNLPDELIDRLALEAHGLGMTVEDRLVEILEPAVAPEENLGPGTMEAGLSQLRAYLERLPGMGWIAVSDASQPYWWVKFNLDVRSPLAWDVVQALGFVLNYLSMEDRLPTVFMPVSPPPYLNGGPELFLSWAIDAQIPFVDAGVIAGILEARLPNPVEDPEAWKRWSSGDDEDDDEGEGGTGRTD